MNRLVLAHCPDCHMPAIVDGQHVVPHEGSLGGVCPGSGGLPNWVDLDLAGSVRLREDGGDAR